jgi:ATP-dependent RNA helicase RhlE
VVNFELPVHAQDYIHRIGRTGRAGMEGHAISLVSFEEEDRLMEVNRLLKRDLPVRVISGYEPSPRGSARPAGGRPSSSAGRTSARRSSVSPRSRPARALGSRDRGRQSSQPTAG